MASLKSYTFLTVDRDSEGLRSGILMAAPVKDPIPIHLSLFLKNLRAATDA